MSITFINPKEVELPSDAEELFSKLRPLNGVNLLQKSTFDKMSSTCYLHQDARTADTYDNVDKDFLENRETFWKIQCYGYHSTGYVLFFKPDLGEVIKICGDRIRDTKICFVTTEPCDLQGNPDDNATRCFNTKLYMHTAVTTLWFKN